MDTVNAFHDSFAGYGYFGVQTFSDRAVFRAFAPNAAKVFLTGEFCNWQTGEELRCLGDGVWQCELPLSLLFEGCRYKCRIVTRDGRELYRADPYAVAGEQSGGYASVLRNISSYEWQDESWIAYRENYKKDIRSRPLNVYRFSVNSWRAREGAEPLTYRQLACELSSYVKQLGCTHVQFLPNHTGAECDGCGSRIACCFSPDMRGEHPRELMSFVDSMHEAGVGVIFEMPVSDALKTVRGFDGQAALESCCDDAAESCPLTAQRTRDYIADVCAFWLDRYHADGLCVRAGDSIDCGGASFEKELFGYLSRGLKKRFPYAVLMLDGCASDSELAREFDLICDGDFLRNTADRKLPSLRRVASVLHRASFGAENTSGERPENYALTRAMLGYIMTLPGKKLLPAGVELGDLCAESREAGLRWDLLERDANAKFQRYVAELGQLYLSSSALWQSDDDDQACVTILPGEDHDNIISFCRRDDGQNEMTVIVNLSSRGYENYKCAVLSRGEYREILNSDDERYGGSGMVNGRPLFCEDVASDTHKSCVTLRLPPEAIVVIRRVG